MGTTTRGTRRVDLIGATRGAAHSTRPWGLAADPVGWAPPTIAACPDTEAPHPTDSRDERNDYTLRAQTSLSPMVLFSTN